MKTIRLATIFLLAIVAIACQKQSTALTVEPSEVLLYSGGTKQLTAEPAEGVTYSSKDEFTQKSMLVVWLQETKSEKPI